jgi:hypothetical protein
VKLLAMYLQCSVSKVLNYMPIVDYAWSTLHVYTKNYHVIKPKIDIGPHYKLCLSFGLPHGQFLAPRLFERTIKHYCKYS